MWVANVSQIVAITSVLHEFFSFTAALEATWEADADFRAGTSLKRCTACLLSNWLFVGDDGLVVVVWSCIVVCCALLISVP